MSFSLFLLQAFFSIRRMLSLNRKAAKLIKQHIPDSISIKRDKLVAGEEKV